MIDAIKRIQSPVLNLMHLYGMQEISSYCGNIDSIDDKCSIYHTASQPQNIILETLKVSDEKLKHDEEEMMKRLTKLASDSMQVMVTVSMMTLLQSMYVPSLMI